ncbi:interferon regulatory factor 4-like [Candoia aspera]|uniref:interferon regulatory factor 4-like n=1 Tax=Candoia aspera TaxID=51853 RepID=UPI002FD81871
MAEAPAPLRLKAWLLAQVESGRYPGLRWENGEKTLFRIPWKHAAKQDYCEREDAALFKAWAVYKGKYQEGLDKADPSVWKTRLRCALNKSTDFREMPEKSHLEVSEPYKVYEVVCPDAAQDTEKESRKESPLQLSCPLVPAQEAASAHCMSNKVSAQVASLQILAMHSSDCRAVSAIFPAVTKTVRLILALCSYWYHTGFLAAPFHARCSSKLQVVHLGAFFPISPTLFPSFQAKSSDEKSKDNPGGPRVSQKLCGADLQGHQVKGFFYTWDPLQVHQHPNPGFVNPRSQFVPGKSVNSDCCLHICLYYCDVLVKEMTTCAAEGCRITYRPVVAENEDLYGPSGMEEIHFPPPHVLGSRNQEAQATRVLERLLPHLHRGVLLWVAPEGVFMKRQCQGRVYWKGPLAPHRDQPNKLEREKTYRLLDTRLFLQQLRGFLSHGEPLPQYQILLCFGEEFPPFPNQKLHRFITAQVEPVFARNLCLHAQRSLQGSQTYTPEAPRNIIQILKPLCSS